LTSGEAKQAQCEPVLTSGKAKLPISASSEANKTVKQSALASGEANRVHNNPILASYEAKRASPSLNALQAFGDATTLTSAKPQAYKAKALSNNVKIAYDEASSLGGTKIKIVSGNTKRASCEAKLAYGEANTTLSKAKQQPFRRLQSSLFLKRLS